MSREIVVAIEKMAFGGAGFGHLDGKACFVPFTAPGDTIKGVVAKEKRSYIEAELLEILSPSTLRISPVCQVFGQCGGCSLQHISYADQLSIKQELFAEQLWRFARVHGDVVSPIVPATAHLAYRARVQIKIRSVNGKIVIGFYRAGTHYIIPFVDGCSIAHPVINELILHIKSLIEGYCEPEAIPQVDVAVGENGQSIVILHYIGKKPETLYSYLESQSDELTQANGIWVQIGRKSGLRHVSGISKLKYVIPAGFLPGMPELALSFSRGGFSQVNYGQNLELIRLVYEMSGLTGKEKVLDLFCGNGNLTAPLARFAVSIVGIDDYGPSIADAEANCRDNSIGNVKFICGDATKEVSKSAGQCGIFDLVLLDPPRTGAAELMHMLPALGPDRIVYISCNPVTLARDIAILNKTGYHVEKSVPVDMFPQTYHIESVTLLKRS